MGNDDLSRASGRRTRRLPDMTEWHGEPEERASASRFLLPNLDAAIAGMAQHVPSGLEAVGPLPWDARARLTTGRGGVTHIGSLQDCVEHWQTLNDYRDRAVIICEIALRASGMMEPAKRLEARDIAMLAKALAQAKGATE